MAFIIDIAGAKPHSRFTIALCRNVVDTADSVARSTLQRTHTKGPDRKLMRSAAVSILLLNFLSFR